MQLDIVNVNCSLSYTNNLEFSIISKFPLQINSTPQRIYIHPLYSTTLLYKPLIINDKMPNLISDDNYFNTIFLALGFDKKSSALHFTNIKINDIMTYKNKSYLSFETKDVKIIKLVEEGYIKFNINNFIVTVNTISFFLDRFMIYSIINERM